ncbi:MAG: hypothetical protein CBB97_10325 [Candidatus Endolissoclinum sp. TMED37]|nr:MAG: hypothetical protein CBB97_10325 [Candidatus Endolissoclinum sp. TMED37]
MRLDEVDKEISKGDLSQLERFADKLFAKVGIDVEFTKHFLDRVNDERNKKQITMSELTRLFKQEFKRWGKPIAQMGPDAEAVMKDLSTDINMPFALRWDRENQELDLVAKSVMRKPDFKTSNPEFPVESKTYNTMSNVGKAKYVVNFHDGEKTHKDGSRFYDMSTFKNAKDLESFEKQLKSKGYVKETKVEEMPIPLSTMYGLVIDGKYVAKGSKEKMRKMQKEKGGTVYNAPGKKVGDSEGKVKEEETITVMSQPKRKISDEEKLAIFNELKFGDTIYLWYDSAFKRGEKYKPFKMGKRTKSEKYNLSKFSMQQISKEGIPGGVKFFFYKRGDKVTLAMGDMAASIVDIQTEDPMQESKMNEDYVITLKGKEVSRHTTEVEARSAWHKLRKEHGNDVKVFKEDMNDDDTEQWYYQEVADHMGASLMNYKEMPGGRDITFGYKGQEVLVSQRWNKDGTEKKPVTKIVTDNDSADLGRYAVWNDSKFYADDLIDVLKNMDDVEEGYKVSSKKPLSSLGGYGNKKLAKKQPSVGDGLSEFYLVVEYKKGQPVRQSDPLRVLDNLAARRDNMPFPIKFADDEEIKITPNLAKRFTMAYHDIARPEQKELIKQYLKTKDGFKRIVNQMQLTKDDFAKNAGANLAKISRNSNIVA